MKDIPMITTFDFDTGTKRMEDCSREELLTVVEWCSAEITRVREAWKRDVEFRKFLEEARRRHGF